MDGQQGAEDILVKSLDPADWEILPRAEVVRQVFGSEVTVENVAEGYYNPYTSSE